MNVESLINVIKRGYTNPKLKGMYTIMGLYEPRWLRMLCQNALYSPLVGPMLSDEALMVSTEMVPAASEYDNDKLVLAQEGPPSVNLPYMEPEDWPYSPVIHAEWRANHELLVSYAGKTWISYCTHGSGADSTLYVIWPEELNLRGDIDISGTPYQVGFEMNFLTPAVYPADKVVSYLRRTNEIFDVFSEGDYAAAVINCNESQETLAIIIAGLYKLLA